MQVLKKTTKNQKHHRSPITAEETGKEEICCQNRKLTLEKYSRRRYSMKFSTIQCCTNVTYTKYEPFFSIQCCIHLHWSEDHAYNIHNAYMITDRYL